MKTFNQFMEEKKSIQLKLNVGGEPQLVYDKKSKKKGKGIKMVNDIGGEPTLIGKMKQESIQPWILDGKYKQALEMLQNSVFFRGQKIDPNRLNLSIGQLQKVFGNELDPLMKMGIIARRPTGNNPFGGDTASYTLVNPVTNV